jgi:hypothetical protein
LIRESTTIPVDFDLSDISIKFTIGIWICWLIDYSPVKKLIDESGYSVSKYFKFIFN